MAQSGSIVGGKFSCAACGKQYTWKPQLAGKKAKCACGATLVVPLAEQAAPPAPDVAREDDLYDVAVAPEPRPTRGPVAAAQASDFAGPPKPIVGGRGTVVAHPVAPTAPARGASAGRAADAPRDHTSDIHDKRRDIYLPLGLIAAGFVGMLIWAFTAAGAGAAGALVISLAVGVSTVVKTFVIILLALIAAPMFGISFGDFRTAIAKFAAVIIFTDMGLLWLDEIIDAVAGEATGRGARRGYWIVTLLFASTVVSFLVRFLFDMDSEEVGYVAAPLVIASLVIGWFLKILAVGILMGIMGAADDAASEDEGPAPPAPAATSPATGAERPEPAKEQSEEGAPEKSQTQVEPLAPEPF